MSSLAQKAFRTRRGRGWKGCWTRNGGEGLRRYKRRGEKSSDYCSLSADDSGRPGPAVNSQMGARPETARDAIVALCLYAGAQGCQGLVSSAARPRHVRSQTRQLPKQTDAVLIKRG
jgi:hypothetical protein